MSEDQGKESEKLLPVLKWEADLWYDSTSRGKSISDEGMKHKTVRQRLLHR